MDSNVAAESAPVILNAQKDLLQLLQERQRERQKINRTFSLMWPASMLIYWNKRTLQNSRSTPTRFSCYSNITKHGGRFLVLEHVLEQQYSSRDVMWKRSIGSEQKKKNLHVLHTCCTCFITFLCHHCRTKTWNFPWRRSWRTVNTRRLIFLFLSKHSPTFRAS